MSDKITLIDVFTLKGVDLKNEGLRTASGVSTWAAASYFMGEKDKITIKNAGEVAENELLSRIILKRLISYILHVTGIHMQRMEMLNWALSHVGSYILIYLWRNKKIPGVMEIVKFMVMMAISDALVYPQLAKLLGQKAETAFNQGYHKMVMSATKNQVSTFQNVVDANIKNPRHKDRYQPHKMPSIWATKFESDKGYLGRAGGRSRAYF